MNLILIILMVSISLIIYKWEKFSNWIINDLLTTKIGQDFQNKILLPVNFWIKWNLGDLKKKNIDKKENRKITFEDNFDKPYLDRGKWNTSFPWGRWVNPYSWITDGDNIKFENNKLHFLTKKEETVHNTWEGKIKRDFTSAHIDTKQKHQQLFGRFDIKVKLSCKRGLWPAFWLLTEDYTHPDIPKLKPKDYENNEEKKSIKPEIDIFEQFGRKSKQMQFNLHGGYLYTSPWGSTFPSKIKGVDFSKNYIKVSVEITKDYIKWFVNDCLTKIIYQKNLHPSERVFRPVYIIVSTGARESLYEICEKNKDHLPDGMIIDWVRAYEALYYNN